MRVISLLAVICSTCALAHIPKTRTLLGRMAKTQGTGAYSISLEIVLPTESEPLRVLEDWVVASSDQMHVTAQIEVDGRKETVFASTYRDGAVTKTGVVSGNRAGEYFFEPLFHARSSGNLIRWLTQHHLINASMLSEARVTQLKSVRHEPDPFLQYIKTDLGFGLALGASPGGRFEPRVTWDPDRLLLTRLKFPNANIEMTAENYDSFARGLMYPRERWVRFDGRAILLRTLEIRARGESAVSAPTLRSTPASTNPSLVTFYERFR